MVGGYSRLHVFYLFKGKEKESRLSQVKVTVSESRQLVVKRRAKCSAELQIGTKYGVAQ